MFFKWYKTEYAKTLTLAVPLIATLWSQMGIEIIDTMMLGRLGVDALAAGGLGFATFLLLFVPAVGFISAVGIMIARAYGRRDYDNAAFCLQQGFWFASLTAIPIMLLMWFFPYLLVPLGYSPTLVAHATSYIHMLMGCVIPGMVIVCLREFIAAFGLPRFLFYSALSALPVNAVFNYLLMYGIGIFPEMGAAGVGLATAIADMYLAILLLLVVRYHRLFKHIGVFSQLYWPDKAVFREIFKVGGPITLSIGIEICLFAGMTFIMGWLSPVALAGHQIVVNLQPFMFMVSFGLSQATAIRIGHAIGAGNMHEVRNIGMSSYHIVLMTATCTALLFWFCAGAIVHLFLDVANPKFTQSVGFAVTFLHIATFLQWPDGMNIVSQGALRGLKDTRAPMYILLFCHWGMGLPLCISLAMFTPLAEAGIWLGLLIAVSMAAILNTRRFAKTTAIA